MTLNEIETYSVSDDVLIEMIGHAYKVVVGKLSKMIQKELEDAANET